MGRLSGPSLSPPHPLFICSPLGVIPKKEPGSFQVINDLSYSKGHSVNDLIPPDITSVSYKDFHHVASLVYSAGKGALLAKADIEVAFRILPKHPADQHLFGFFCKGCFYYDNCLLMGCPLSCALFEIFAPPVS